MYRPGVTVYEVTEPTPAASGIVSANPQNGAGGLPQLYIPNYSNLKPVQYIPFKPTGP
jgi:hypothetical protein